MVSIFLDLISAFMYQISKESGFEGIVRRNRSKESKNGEECRIPAGFGLLSPQITVGPA